MSEKRKNQQLSCKKNEQQTKRHNNPYIIICFTAALCKKSYFIFPPQILIIISTNFVDFEFILNDVQLNVNLFYFSPENPVCRKASYNTMAAELDKFKDRAASLFNIGILIRVSG